MRCHLGRLFLVLLLLLMPLGLFAHPSIKPSDNNRDVRIEILKEAILREPSQARRALLAKAYGLSLDEIGERGISPSSNQVSTLQANTIQSNVPVFVDTRTQSWGQVVAINPSNPQHIVAAMTTQVFLPERHLAHCQTTVSFDGGDTWGNVNIVPLMFDNSEYGMLATCDSPAISFSPDGSRVYVAYYHAAVDQTNYSNWWESGSVFVIYSDDGGLTWTGPITALEGSVIWHTQQGGPPVISPGSYYSEPAIATSTDGSGVEHVYISATKRDVADSSFGFGYVERSHVVFTRSDARGYVGSWTTPEMLESTPVSGNPYIGESDSQMVLAGSRVAGGTNGSVLVAWFDSNGPGSPAGVGPLPPEDLIGFAKNSFIIRSRYSVDHGATFGPLVNAAVDTLELESGHQFFAFMINSMYPDLKVAVDGSAHVVYTNMATPHPAEELHETEMGDIRYISSAGPPYDTWTPPETVNDDGLHRQQALAALATAGNNVYVSFYDTRLSPDAAADRMYDVFGARKEIGSTQGWENFRISDASSPITENLPVGQRFAIAAAADGSLFAAWQDRRYLTHSNGLGGNIYGQAYRSVPSIAAISPNTRPAGGPEFTLTVNGTGFFSDSVVRWNGADRPTTFVSSTELTASIPASDLASGGTAKVTVFNAKAPGTGTGSGVSFTISDYSIGSAPSSSTVTAGQAATYTISVIPTGSGHDAAVSLTCSGLPANATCSFSPTSLTPSTGTATSTLTIATAGRATLAAVPLKGPWLLALWLPFCGLGVVVIGSGSRKKMAGMVLGLVLTLALGASLVGCGGNKTQTTPPPPSTPQGTYTITVIGSSGAVSHTGTITLVVR